MGIATIVSSALLSVIGLYLTHSFRRQQSLKIAEKRVGAYRGLWELTKVARRTRWDPADGSGALSRDEARKLFRDMADWYYDKGNGMFLTATTTEFYFLVRTNLNAYAMSNDEKGAGRCMRDLSLLRQQMRLDLKTISGRPSYWDKGKLNQGDKKLLLRAGIHNPERWGRPWYRAIRPAPDNDVSAEHATNDEVEALLEGVAQDPRLSFDVRFLGTEPSGRIAAGSYVPTTGAPTPIPVEEKPYDCFTVHVLLPRPREADEKLLRGLPSKLTDALQTRGPFLEGRYEWGHVGDAQLTDDLTSTERELIVRDPSAPDEALFKLSLFRA
jgi:hypothetical protein